MDFQATMTVGDKQGARGETIISGGASYPVAGEVRIVSLVPNARTAGGDLAITNTLKICIDYARDNNLYTTSGSVYVVTTPNGGKAGVRTGNVASDVVTGEVGLMIVGAMRGQGSRNITDNAHVQLIDWARENNYIGG